MCDFFSLRSDGAGKIYYFSLEQRKRFLAENNMEYQEQHFDSHSAIGAFFGFNGKDDDMLNKYEYNPATGELVVDTMVNRRTMDDREAVKEALKQIPMAEYAEMYRMAMIPKRENCTEYQWKNVRKHEKFYGKKVSVLKHSDKYGFVAVGEVGVVDRFDETVYGIRLMLKGRQGPVWVKASSVQIIE